MIIYTPPKPADSIPLINLADSFSPDLEKRKAVAWEIHKACRDIGFFYVENHGVPDALLVGQFDFVRRFFALPMETKEAVGLKDSAWLRGYEAMKRQTLDLGSPPDLKESYMLSSEPAEGEASTEQARRHQGENPWPDGLPGFKDQMLAYTDHIVKLGKHLMACLALSLDLDEDFFAAGLQDPSHTVRLLHYPPHPENAEFNQLGAGAHTDWGAITMLLQDRVGGLEVQNAQGEWIRADPIPGTFIINLGDMIRRWTNDLYHSNRHRVLNNASGLDRYSVATFFNPNYFYRVECLPTCRPATGEPIYAPCTVGEHTDEMYRLTYGIA
ncbi:MAG: penicillin synthase [Rhodospirillales bacterium]|nr:penicillin synthase [Rhodospirillales bacterium]